MEIVDPDAEVYHLFVEGEKVANLYQPQFEDIFWCSYRVVPVSDAADVRLRAREIWEQVRFVVKHLNGRDCEDGTFAGWSYAAFCNKDSDRFCFRSLWPPKSRLQRTGLLRLILGPK